MDNAARVLGGKGEFAIITASLTAANMIEWQKYIEARRPEKYPEIKMAALRPCDDLQKKAFDEANTILNANPDVKLIMAICTPGRPRRRRGRQAVGPDRRQGDRPGPAQRQQALRPRRHHRLRHPLEHDGPRLPDRPTPPRPSPTARSRPATRTFEAGRLGTIEIEGDNILLGKPFTFTKENIDQFDF